MQVPHAPYDASRVFTYRSQGDRNDTVSFFDVKVDDADVPFIEVCVWPSNGGTQVYPIFEDNGSLRWERPTGPSQLLRMDKGFEPEWVWTVTVDGRMAYDFDAQGEAEQAVCLAAAVGALNAGFTSASRSHYKTPDGGVPVNGENAMEPSDDGSVLPTKVTIYNFSGESGTKEAWQPEAWSREHKKIPDPTVKTKLPTNLLHAISSCHGSLVGLVRRIEGVLAVVGDPDPDQDPYAIEGDGDPQTALDFARESVQYAKISHSLVDRLETAVGLD